jgi:hypothetical protein
MEHQRSKLTPESPSNFAPARAFACLLALIKVFPSASEGGTCSLVHLDTHAVERLDCQRLLV